MQNQLIIPSRLSGINMATAALAKSSSRGMSRRHARPKGTVVSLFSGCGGSDAGLHSLGFDVLMANDIFQYGRDLYLQNLPETDFQCKDVAEIKSFPSADLLVGCYPCQGFSQGGARESDRKINYLYREFDRALRQIKPKAFIVENVSGMRRSDFSHLLENQIRRFRMAGYKVGCDMLKAEDFGVPQERRRIFIVGIRSDFGVHYQFPLPTHGPGRPNKHSSIGDALDGLPLWPEGEYFDDKFHWYYMSRNRRRDWNELSKTIVSHPRHMPLHPVSPKLVRVHTDKWVWENDSPARRFSYREASRIQGFSNGLEFPETGSMRDKYTAIGNAVPPPLFAAVAGNIPNIW